MIKYITLTAILILIGCNSRDAKISLWHERFEKFQRYDEYLHQVDVIVDMCKNGIIKIGDDKEYIVALLGIPNDEVVKYSDGAVVYSVVIYYTGFTFEYDENNKIREGGEMAEEGASISGYQTYSMKDCR